MEGRRRRGEPLDARVADASLAPGAASRTRRADPKRRRIPRRGRRGRRPLGRRAAMGAALAAGGDRAAGAARLRLRADSRVDLATFAPPRSSVRRAGREPSMTRERGALAGAWLSRGAGRKPPAVAVATAVNPGPARRHGAGARRRAIACRRAAARPRSASPEASSALASGRQAGARRARTRPAATRSWASRRAKPGRPDPPGALSSAPGSPLASWRLGRAAEGAGLATVAAARRRRRRQAPAGRENRTSALEAAALTTASRRRSAFESNDLFDASVAVGCGAFGAARRRAPRSRWPPRRLPRRRLGARACRHRRCLPGRLRRHRRRREGRQRLPRPAQDAALPRQPRDRLPARHGRQRLPLRLAPLPAAVPAAEAQAPPRPAARHPSQRQGRAAHPGRAARVGLCPLLRQLRPARCLPAGLATPPTGAALTPASTAMHLSNRCART